MTAASARALTQGLGIELDGFSWRHPGRSRWAVRNVTLRIEPGERVLIAGSSGSGKSTLLRFIAGLTDPQDAAEALGSITYSQGGAVLDGAAARRGIGLMMQDPETNLLLTRVGDDVAFGLENAQLPRDQIWAGVSRSLDRVGFPYGLQRPTAALSGGEKQRVGLAGLLAREPQLLVLDEPTANLDPDGAAITSAALADVLTQSQATMIIVEHRISDVLELVDRLVLLTPAGIAADGRPAQILDANRAEFAGSGVFVSGWEAAAALPDPPAPTDEPVLFGEAITVARGPDRQLALNGVTVTATKGTATAIIGRNGAGKSTLARVLGGLLTPTEGQARVPAARKPLHKLKSRDLAGAVGSVFQEPEHQFVAGTAADELAIGARAIGMDRGLAQQRSQQLLAQLGLTHLAQANPYTLSGGEKRRLAVGAALVGSPQVLILDEPTFGQDANSWAAITGLLIDELHRGTSLIVITHDSALVRALNARTVTLAAGQIAGVTS